jgi:hypothetical protein
VTPDDGACKRRSREQRAESSEQRAVSRDKRAESRIQRAKSREQITKSRKQRAKSKEQRAESREQRADGREQSRYLVVVLVDVVEERFILMNYPVPSVVPAIEVKAVKAVQHCPGEA